MNTSTPRLKYKTTMGTKGITLIEVVIALALLGIVLTSIFSFYSFSTDTFNTAQKKSDVQHEVLSAAEFITKELRTATVVSLSLDGTPTQNNELYNSRIGLKNGYIEYYYKDKSTRIANANITQISVDLNKNTNLLEFYIIGDKDGQRYRIDSKVALVNLKKLPNQDFSGTWIHYYNPSID